MISPKALTITKLPHGLPSVMRATRLYAGLTQHDMAAEYGLDVARYSAIETMHQEPSADEERRIHEWLSDFFHEIDSL